MVRRFAAPVALIACDAVPMIRTASPTRVLTTLAPEVNEAMGELDAVNIDARWCLMQVEIDRLFRLRSVTIAVPDTRLRPDRQAEAAVRVPEQHVSIRPTDRVVTSEGRARTSLSHET